MKIAGLERCSFVDWPGMMTAVVFAPGCNIRCYYCHNFQLLGSDDAIQMAPSEGVLGWLESRIGFLDGVVISGGEPLLQSGLPVFIDQIRAMGYPVKLDTNGTLPDELELLLRSDRIDYVAMDLKAPREAYETVCGTAIDQHVLDRSIACIMKYAPDYEFRTTVLPEFTELDVLGMAQRIRGARRYILQQVHFPKRKCDMDDIRLAATPHAYIEVQTMSRKVKAQGLVQCCETRGLVPSEATDTALSG